MKTSLCKFLLTTPLLMAKAAWPNESVQGCPAVVLKSQDTLLFAGCIDATGVKEFIAKSGQNLKAVVIQSAGGDVTAALEMARQIERAQPIVVVAGYCISSCANYLLPASERTYVLDGTFILLHGDAASSRARLELLGQLSESDRQAFESAVASEQPYLADNPRAASIHAMQMVTLMPRDHHFSLQLPGKGRVDCVGQDASPWRLGLALLEKAGIARLGAPKGFALPDNFAKYIQTVDNQDGYQSPHSDPTETCVALGALHSRK